MERIRQIQKNGMRFIVGFPDYPLSLWVDHFFVAHGNPFYNQRRVFPNNHVDLFFNLANLNKGKLENAAHDFEFRNTVVSGLRSSFMSITPTGFFDIAGLRFRLFGFSCLFNIPAIKIANENFSADEVLGPEVNDIRQRLGDCTDLLRRLSILEDWMLTKTSSASSDIRLWNHIERKFRSLSFRSRTELSSVLGYSYRHSLSIITAKTGLHPKAIDRIYRLDQLLASISKQAPANWANIAYHFGYSDQSHMIREFRAFTGFTPKEFIQQGWFAPIVHEAR
jgi:AraC-like DNA-binding protein